MQVSIGIPFYNSERTLADTLRSVFAQTFTDWELILVDDGSTDGSLEIARAVNDPRVRVLHDTVNRGLPYRLNEITACSQGRYIARMDSDDLMHPLRIEKQVRYLDEHPEVDVVGAGIYTIDSGNSALGIRGIGPIDMRPQSVLQKGCLPHPTLLGRAEWFKSNPYDETYPRAEDAELWDRVCRSSALAAIPEPLVYYREDTISLKAYLKTARSNRKRFQKYGPAVVGLPLTMLLVAQSHLKGLTYRLFTLAGVQKYLVSKRSRPLTEEEGEDALEGLRIVFNTPVPGLDPTS